MTLRRAYRTLPYLACALACLIVDLLYFPPRLIFPDESRFLGSAAHLVTTGQFSSGGGRAWEMPGTALFFAPAVWLFGPHDAIIPIRLAQAALLVIQCGLIGLIARRLFHDATAAFMASLIAALYPFLLFYQGLLLSETLFNTFFLAAIAALLWWRERGMSIDFALVAASFLFAAATLTKATLTVLPPLLLAVTAWLSGASWRRVVCGLGHLLVPLRRLHESLVDPQCGGLACVRSVHHGQRQQSLSRQQSRTIPTPGSIGRTMPTQRSSHGSTPCPASLHGNAPTRKRRCATSKAIRRLHPRQRPRNSSGSGTSFPTRPSSTAASTP